MENEPLKISLLPAPGEGSRGSSAYQRGLGGFAASLRSHGIEIFPRYYPNPALGESGGLIGEFTISEGVTATALTALRPSLGEWIKGRDGREAKLSLGPVVVRARTAEEVEKLTKLAETYQKKVHNE